jgi:hypothetical protein
VRRDPVFVATTTREEAERFSSLEDLPKHPLAIRIWKRRIQTKLRVSGVTHMLPKRGLASEDLLTIRTRYCVSRGLLMLLKRIIVVEALLALLIR